MVARAFSGPSAEGGEPVGQGILGRRWAAALGKEGAPRRRVGERRPDALLGQPPLSRASRSASTTTRSLGLDRAQRRGDAAEADGLAHWHNVRHRYAEPFQTCAWLQEVLPSGGITAGRMGAMVAGSKGGATSSRGFFAGASVGLSQSCCCWPLTKVQRQAACAVPEKVRTQAAPERARRRQRAYRAGACVMCCPFQVRYARRASFRNLGQIRPTGLI